MDLSRYSSRRGSEHHEHWWHEQSSPNAEVEPLYVEALREHVAQHC